MKIIPNLIKDRKDEQLVQMTSSMNRINPVIDRITDDDSVDSVILINQEGDPIYTNVPVINATNIGKNLCPLGRVVRDAVKDLNVLDNLMVLRIDTKKYEIMMVPEEDFGVVVVQRARLKAKKMAKKL
ncbi:roadblock/LC7 domain-containing protein [Phthorimaea operculella]|nr:roadblock/LC7 domain-containing protein [Phthorimaea operculella]